jgi:flagellar motor switch protein FliG
MSEIDNYSKLTGAEKAAIVLLSIEDKNAALVFKTMSEDEIKEVSYVMSNLGSVKQDVIDRLLQDFTNEISNAVSFTGNIETTEKLLSKILEKEKLDVLLEEIRGPSGKNTWEKLSHIQENVLAGYLKNEYPQTIAVIISKLSPQYAARVLSILPEDLSFDVMLRMLNMEPVKKEVLDNVERALRTEFISATAKAHRQDSSQIMAEIFNNFDRTNENKYMSMLESRVPETAEKIKSLMFTFDDIGSVNAAGIQALLRVIDKNKLSIALKGASERIRKLFFDNMSQRAAKIMQEDMVNMGPVKLRDVDEAQNIIVNIAKEMATKGEITVSAGDDKDELIY